MKVFNCILGVFAILGATYCIFFPGVTFINAGWIVTFLLGAWGVCAIFDYFSNRKNQDKPKFEAVMGVLGLVCGICAAVFSTMALFIPAVRLIIDVTMLYLFCGWMAASGVTSIMSAVKAKRESESKMWVWTLVWGIIVIVGALYGCLHMMFLAKMIGLLIGLLLITYGVSLICSVFADDN